MLRFLRSLLPVRKKDNGVKLHSFEDLLPTAVVIVQFVSELSDSELSMAELKFRSGYPWDSCLERIKKNWIRNRLARELLMAEMKDCLYKTEMPSPDGRHKDDLLMQRAAVAVEAAYQFIVKEKLLGKKDWSFLKYK